MGFIPKKPSGNSDESLFQQAVWEELWGRKFVPYVRPKPVETAVVQKSVQIKELLLVQIFSDYVVGKDVSVTPNKLYQVARPYWQRNSLPGETALDGTHWTFAYTKNARLTVPPAAVTYDPLAFVSRTKVSGNAQVRQRITPEFLVNDVFYATQLSSPATDGQGHNVVSAGPALGDTLNAAGTPITWTYEDGRHWGDTPDGLV